MNFIKMLIGIPFVIVLLIFAFVNNDLATFNLWPFYIEVTVSLSVAIIFFIVFGFIWGKADSWMSYAPMRKTLRNQKKQNKKLSKEQMKLSKEMEGLQDNLNNFKEREALLPKPTFKQKLAKFFKSKKKEEK